MSRAGRVVEEWVMKGKEGMGHKVWRIGLEVWRIGHEEDVGESQRHGWIERREQTEGVGVFGGGQEG